MGNNKEQKNISVPFPCGFSASRVELGWSEGHLEVVCLP